jgi:hypothetical protein
MLLAILVPSLWLIGFIIALAIDSQLKITKHSYPSVGNFGIYITGRSTDSYTKFQWRHLWIHLPRRTFFVRFRTNRWEGYQ